MTRPASTPTWPYEKVMDQMRQRYQKESLSDYWEAEKEALSAAIRSIAEDLPVGRYSPIKTLGVGGSGVVLHLSDKLFPKGGKALKFPRPVPGKVKLVTEMLAKEISFLAELRHPGVVGVDYYNTLHKVNEYGDLPYYLMEFVDGSKSKDFMRDPLTSDESFGRVVRQTAEILSYLHTAPTSFAHLDIKPDNILITDGGNPIVIDLGTCKRIGAADGLTTVACTRSFAHPKLVQKLTEDPSDENRAKGDLERSEIDPIWDLWSFGITLLTWLGIDFEDGKISGRGIYHRLPTYNRKYYLLLAARLLSGSGRSWLSERVGLSNAFLGDFPVNSSVELLEILGRIDSDAGPIANTPELDLKSARTIQAAPSNHVACTPALLAVLRHRLYRRLNSVTQLGLVCHIYPAAKHSRKEHSLGTYANAARMIRALYNDANSPLFRQILTEEDCRAVLLSSLIHDLGHFPLGHELEEIDKKVFSHAELTLAMIKGGWKRKKKGARHLKFDSLDPVLKLWGTRPDRIISILSAKANHQSASRKDKLLRSIFSGPIDADKLDYLFRDARNTDVTYPLGVDIDRLFRCITTVVVDRVAGGARDVPTIGVHAKGKVAAEFLTLARYAMFSQVYWHHAVRAQKAMLFRAVESILASLTSEPAMEEFKSEFVATVVALPEVLYQDPPQTLFPDVYNRNRIGTIEFGTDLAATDAAVLSWFRDRLRSSGNPNAILIDGILSRVFFKRLWVVSCEMERDRWSRIVNLWDQLDRPKRHQASLNFEREISKLLTPEGTASVTAMKASEARDKIEEYTAAQRPWLLMDIPGNRPGADVGLQCVQEGQRRQLRKDDRVVGDLQISTVWENYARDLREAAGKIRIFCDPALVDTIESSIKWEVGIESLEDTLGQSI